MSVTISELIGFPVSKEHGDELLKRMSTYNQMTKKELISLLLQHDWELLQTQQAMPKKITKNTMTEYLSEVGSRIQRAIEATHAAKVIAEMKRDHSPEFIDNYLKWLDENSHVEYHGAVRKVVLDADLDELRRHFDLFRKFKEE